MIAVDDLTTYQKYYARRTNHHLHKDEYGYNSHKYNIRRETMLTLATSPQGQVILPNEVLQISTWKNSGQLVVWVTRLFCALQRIKKQMIFLT